MDAAVAKASRAPMSRGPWAIVLLGLALQLPGFGLGFFLDDYGHALVFTDLGAETPMRWWSLFDFGSRQDWAGFGASHGGLPWWTSEDWSVRFFRPLASASLALDHRLFGTWAAGHHLTSWLGFGALLVAVHRLLGAIGLAESAARRGLLFFALSHTTVLPVQWIANRNTVLEALFTVLALLALHAGPATRRRTIVALLCAAAAAASKESGVVAFALVAVVCAARRRRVEAAVALGLGAAYVVALAWAGFGERSLFYATPWRDPLQFSSHVALLATGGLLALLGPFTLDAIAQTRAAWLPVAVVGAMIGGAVVVWVARTVRGRPGTALLATWLALSLLPQGGVLPSDRLLLVPAIAAAGLLASFFDVRAQPGSPRVARWARRLIFASVTFGSGALLIAQGVLMVSFARHLRTTIAATDVGPPQLGPRFGIVLQTESSMQGFGLGTTWLGTGGDRDVRFVLLQAGPRAVRWTRTGASSFELESQDEPFLTSPFERVYLAREPDFAPGATWSSPPLAIEALEVEDGHPRKLRIVSSVPLDDPSMRFLRPENGVLTHLPPPSIGALISIPRAVSPLPFVP